MRLSVESFVCLPSADRVVINEWLTDHGVDWAPCIAVRIEGEGPVVAECLEHDGVGYRVVDGDVVVIDVPFTARRLPDARIMADWFRHEQALALAVSA